MAWINDRKISIMQGVYYSNHSRKFIIKWTILCAWSFLFEQIIDGVFWILHSLARGLSFLGLKYGLIDLKSVSLSRITYSWD